SGPQIHPIAPAITVAHSIFRFERVRIAKVHSPPAHKNTFRFKQQSVLADYRDHNCPCRKGNSGPGYRPIAGRPDHGRKKEIRMRRPPRPPEAVSWLAAILEPQRVRRARGARRRYLEQT